MSAAYSASITSASATSDEPPGLDARKAIWPSTIVFDVASTRTPFGNTISTGSKNGSPVDSSERSDAGATGSGATISESGSSRAPSRGAMSRVSRAAIAASTSDADGMSSACAAGVEMITCGALLVQRARKRRSIASGSIAASSSVAIAWRSAMSAYGSPVRKLAT